MISKSKPSLAVLALIAVAAGCALVASAGDEEAREPLVGGPTENGEAVFDGMPKTITSHSRIAPPDQPGEPLQIDGTVTWPTGEPAEGIIVYAYQTDAAGIYPPVDIATGTAGDRHGVLRGWTQTDAAGRYRFDTIRPGGYPGRSTPQHVHLHIIEPGRCTYYIDDLLFSDDPRLTDAVKQDIVQHRAGAGVATPTKTGDTWHVTRDIELGKNIPDWPPRSREAVE